MKKFKIGLSFLLFSLFSSNSGAVADLQNVTITALNMNRGLGNFLFIRTSATPTVVGCQTNPDWNLILPLDSDLSNKIYSALLAAQASQSKVILGGTGTCNSSFGIELLNNFTILKP
ncbi:hypothetical protein CBP51_19345 [Cellvibrio mixtus]|uniref:Uncharacterized protein n=1 Tax=Cellvibrio mixtus TaxID=39650 RepID=A0A266Q286_9GAMM|nr:hypothetical protein [Cellvibrio mixtus]OZY83950.1 hypothetical protein CBP51_19345 [Cellvibrio mixtus]